MVVADALDGIVFACATLVETQGAVQNEWKSVDGLSI